MKRSLICSLCLILSAVSFADEPRLLDDQFVLPKGFHIYRAATQKLTGGSYDLTFDGQGRLLVGDGNAVRRLKDENGDGVYDSYEVIADGPATAGRGPQGLLVYGDHLYVVAGDGVQLFSGYESGGKLKHERRLGANFNTGGDHAAHTVLRGLDGYVYLVTGDGAGTTGRKHITEDSSPVLQERAACVFRLDPEGQKWECIGSGGRNPPSLGMNYLGEFFSFDSDMEFHVDVPFYRPVSLNHWATGGDQGWQSVGAFRRYFVDSLPAVREVGRGSPNWGVVYEHQQFPPSFRDAFIACDYRWKSATTGGYATSGRLVAFHLKRKGASWTSGFTELAKAKPGAKDAQGKSINFALVDVDVAPDGSLLVTDHNQGIWRIFYDPQKRARPKTIDQIAFASDSSDRLTRLLSLPQPGSEWSRLQEETIKNDSASGIQQALQDVVLDQARPAPQRLRAIRLLAPGFKKLPRDFLQKLVTQKDEELVAQAAWLVGIRGNQNEVNLLQQLLLNRSSFVRRRAAEGLARISTAGSVPSLALALRDESRAVRYAAMTALAHRPTSEIMAEAKQHSDFQVLVRVLVAAHLRKERPGLEPLQEMVGKLLDSKNLGIDDQVDLLRVLSLYRNELKSNPILSSRIHRLLQESLPRSEGNLRWELIRLSGQYKVVGAYGQLVEQLLEEKDRVTQFHIASAVGDIPRPQAGWPKTSADRFTDWLLSTQSGWFSEFGGKGLQFPGFWGTTLNKVCQNHLDELAGKLDQLKPDSQMARSVFTKLESVTNAEMVLLGLYRKAGNVKAKKNVADLLRKINSQKVASFLLAERQKTNDRDLRRSLTISLAANGRWLKTPAVFLAAMFEFDDAATLTACMNGIAGCGKPFAATGANTELLKRFQEFPQVKQGNTYQLMSFRLLELMVRHPDLASQIEQTLVTLSGSSPDRKTSQPMVIWSSSDKKDGDRAFFVKSFELSDRPAKSEIVLTCDNEYVLFVNGKKISASDDWTRPRRVDLQKSLSKGKNVIAIEARNQGGPAGLIAVVSWQFANGKAGRLVTDSTWFFSTRPQPDWKTNGPQKGDWALSMDVTGPTKNAMDAYLGFVGGKQVFDDLVVQEFWNQWYLQQFKTAFVARPIKEIALRPDTEILELIKSTSEIKGDPVKGRALYLKAGCYACHGGIENKKTTIFGPALGGVTLRLKRVELAEAIVLPSKQVVERFKASMIATADGKSYTGFITEQTDEFVTITDIENNITRIARGDIEQIKAQNKSLMPEKLLNRLTNSEIGDLLAFLESLK